MNDAKSLSPNDADPWAQLPVIHPDSIDWDSLEYEAPPAVRATIGAADVDRICNEQWEGVNGQWSQGLVGLEWQDWTQTISLETTPGSLLHILPYVNIVD